MSLNSCVKEETTNIFQELINKACCELYSGCLVFSSFNFLLTMMHVKVFNCWINKSFDMMLEIIRHVFPMRGTNVPSSFYEAKHKLCDLRFGYATIHAFKYNYLLYWKEFPDLQHCLICGESQHKVRPIIEKKIMHSQLIPR